MATVRFEDKWIRGEVWAGVNWAERPDEKMLSQYFEVVFKDFDYSAPNWRELVAWCAENQIKPIWAEAFDRLDLGFNLIILHHFYFEKEQDAMMFKLRWEQ